MTTDGDEGSEKSDEKTPLEGLADFRSKAAGSDIDVDLDELRERSKRERSSVDYSTSIVDNLDKLTDSELDRVQTAVREEAAAREETNQQTGDQTEGSVDEAPPFEPISSDTEFGDDAFLSNKEAMVGDLDTDAKSILRSLESVEELQDDEFQVVLDTVLDELRRRRGIEHLTLNERLNARYGDEYAGDWITESSYELRPSSPDEDRRKDSQEDSS